jgi:hypothetical protein
MIQGHGNSNAEILLLADGGYNEDFTSNYALSGYNERQIQMLAGSSFHVSETYRTLLIKEKISYTPTGKDPYYKSTDLIAKVKAYAPILLDEIATIKPNLIVPLGELSFRFLTSYENIRKYRGSCVLSAVPEITRPVKVLPTYGPHIWNSEYKQRWISRIDFEKVPQYRGTREPSELNIKIWTARTYSALRSFLNRYADSTGPLVFDIETFCGIPTCLSLCYDGIESVCIPLLDYEIDFDQRVLMLGAVAKILVSDIPKVNQNIKYDWKILERFNFRVNNVVGDTMLASSCLLPELPKNLGFLNSIYTDIPYFKDEGREWDPKIHKREQYYLYNAKDSLSTWRIHDSQLKELAQVGSLPVYENLVKLIPIYKTMENNGLRYDDDARLRLLGKYESLYNIQSLTLNKILGSNVNPKSSVQMARVVYEELGYKQSREASATGEEELEWLMAFGHANNALSRVALECIIACRKIHKVIEYLETIPYPDGKWRCEYNLAGTETGRSSAGVTTDSLLTIEETKSGVRTVWERLGRSFQTIAKHGFKIDGEMYGKDLRSIFVPTDGYEFVEIDLSQAEARVDAVLAGNFKILEIFDTPIGIHRLTGSWVYNCNPLDIKKDTLEYLISKNVRHAGERNVKEQRLVMMVLGQCSLEEARRVLKIFHEKQPEIRDVFHRDIRECITKTRTLTAPNGRTRQFLDRINDHTFNEGISYLPQAIVSDQNKFSLIPTMGRCGDFANLINEAHDSTLAEVLKGHREEYIEIYKQNVETPIDFRKGSLPRDYNLIIPCEATYSDTNWLEMRKI